MADRPFKRTCPRCNGTGRYDRGTCFTCRGAKVIASKRPPVPRWEVSAIFDDGERRRLCTTSANTLALALEAGSKKMALAPDRWQAETIQARQLAM